jgi:hypothetical protein
MAGSKPPATVCRRHSKISTDMQVGAEQGEKVGLRQLLEERIGKPASAGFPKRRSVGCGDGRDDFRTRALNVFE